MNDSSIYSQESEKGHWHIPIISGDGLEVDRTWLCVTRALSRVVTGSEGKSPLSFRLHNCTLENPLFLCVKFLKDCHLIQNFTVTNKAGQYI